MAVKRRKRHGTGHHKTTHRAKKPKALKSFKGKPKGINTGSKKSTRKAPPRTPGVSIHVNGKRVV